MIMTTKEVFIAILASQEEVARLIRLLNSNVLTRDSALTVESNIRSIINELNLEGLTDE